MMTDDQNTKQENGKQGNSSAKGIWSYIIKSVEIAAFLATALSIIFLAIQTYQTQKQINIQQANEYLSRKTDLLSIMYNESESCAVHDRVLPPASRLVGNLRTYCPPKAHLRTRIDALRAFVSLEHSHGVARPDLNRVNFAFSSLDRIDLSYCNFFGADLTGASLVGTSFVDANLSGADMQQAQLYEANLQSANLRGVDFTAAQLCGANLEGVKISPGPLTFLAKGENSVTDEVPTIWIAAVCPDGTLSDENNGTCIGHLTPPASLKEVCKEAQTAWKKRHGK
jgi:hypothetical protein